MIKEVALVFSGKIKNGILNSIVLAIKIYQEIFSPDKGFFSFFFPVGACRFYPSCSEYMKEAVEQKGVFRGLFLGIKRILRCHPLNHGGVDLLK